MSREILLVTHNHFDPTWRRCFARNAEYNGVTVRSYADIEERCFNGWLELAPEGYTYSEGQTSIWREYLRRNPEKLPLLKEYAANGQLAVMMAGETVQDSNMPAAEALIRNFLAAMPLYREIVGEDHPGLKLAWLEDAFGNNPNYPQVLKGVGAEIACFTTYRRVHEDAWVGIDGTKILCMDNIHFHGNGCCEKYPPCPSCSGVGCDVCHGSGLTDYGGFYIEQIRQVIETAITSEDEPAIILISAEETFPDARIPELIHELNTKYEGQACIRFATLLDIYNAYKPRLEAYMAQRDDTPTEDLNPAMPGTMVSRIKCKQRTREIAYKLITSESILADKAWKSGNPCSSPDDFARAWQLVTFNQFHDAITGTHIDSAYVELMDMLDEADETASRLIHESSEPEQFFTEPAREPEQMKLGAFDVLFDRTGIISILKDGRDVFGSAHFIRNRRDFRIGELTIDTDFGDAWGQRIESFGGMQCDLTQVQLGDFHDSVLTSENAIQWHGVYNGGDPKIHNLEWTVTLQPSSDRCRLDFITDVDWDTESRRLRAVFPINSKDPSAIWEVPFGYISRNFEPEKINYSQWSSNTMEFPALHWVRRDVDETSGVAVLNKGLPCYRWMPGRLDISLLRSPEWQFCSTENAYYEFWDIVGQQDKGAHRLEYAILPYYDGLTYTELTKKGYEYNMPHTPNPPFSVTGHVVVTAWKCAEDCSGWIIRLQEAEGKSGEFALGFDTPHTVTPTDMLERPIADGVSGSKYKAPIHKHGVVTLLIQK